MARPKSTDPKTQRNVYPPSSMWDEIVKLATAEGRPASEVFVSLAREALDMRAAGWKGKPSND